MNENILAKLSILRDKNKDLAVYFMTSDEDALDYKKVFILLDIVDSDGHSTKEPISNIFCSDEIKYIENTFVIIYRDIMRMNFTDETIECINRFRSWKFR